MADYHLLRALHSGVSTEEVHLALHLRQGYGAQSRAVIRYL